MTQISAATATAVPHGDADHGHVPHLAHHFDTMGQQVNTGKLGMWVFLCTEVLMFGGLFGLYGVWRALHGESFELGHLFLDKNLGALNTTILICSSFTMAWAVRTAQLGKSRATVLLLLITFLGGAGFMGVKYHEYAHKFEYGLGPGIWYHAPEIRAKQLAEEAAHAKAVPAAPAVAPAAAPTLGTALPEGAAGPTGLAAAKTTGVSGGEHAEAGEGHSFENYLGMTPEQIVIARPFISIYFLMTFLHGIHVLVGMGLIAWIMIRAHRGEFGPHYCTPVDLVGLYWHLVDLIWIFLFPLLYLIK